MVETLNYKNVRFQILLFHTNYKNVKYMQQLYVGSYHTYKPIRFISEYGSVPWLHVIQFYTQKQKETIPALVFVTEAHYEQDETF